MLALASCKGPSATALPEAPVSPAAPAAAPAQPTPAAADAGQPARPPESRGAKAGAPGVAILEDESTITFDTAGRRTTRSRRKFRIVDVARLGGWSSLAIGWAPWFQGRPELHATVTSPTGQATPLDPKTISEAGEDAESPEMYSDRRVLRAPLPALTPGAVVEYEILERETRPFFEGSAYGRFDFGEAVPVPMSRLTVEAPRSTHLRYAVQKLPRPPREEVRGDLRVITFEPGPLPAIESPEPYAPPSESPWPRVEYSIAPSWNELARRYAEIVDRQIRASAGDTALAAPHEPSRERIIGHLLARLQDRVRYTGLEFGEGAIVPTPPSETLRRGYGDCKDKATLLVAMLRAAKIDASVALVRSGFGSEGAPDLPGLERFNHAIVHVEGTPELWIDPTFEYGRAGELPLSVQDHLALIARPGTTHLVRIPRSKPADNTYLEVREVFLSDLGPSRIVETSEGVGSMEQRLRATFARTPEPELRKNLQPYVESNYAAERISRVERFGAEGLDQKFRFRIEMDRAPRGFSSDVDAVVRVSGGAVLSWLPSFLLEREEGQDDQPHAAAEDREETERAVSPRHRRHDLVLAEPYVAEVRYKIRPPLGFTTRGLPENTEVKVGPALLSEKFSAAADGTVEVSFRFDTRKSRYSPAEVAALVDALPKVRAGLEQTIAFDHQGARLIAEGRIAEGLALYRKAVEAHPDAALHHSRLASALLTAGFGEAARAEARLAVAREPKSAHAQMELGWVLAHDLLGRLTAPGSDFAGAIEAYRAAKALDPRDQNARRNLAILLEYDPLGRRYGRGAHLDEAIAEYQAIRKDLNDKSLDDNLMTAMLRAGRLADLRALAREAGATPRAHALRLAAVAALDGRPGVTRELDRLGLDTSTRQAVLDGASLELMNIRRYAEAMMVTTEALGGSANTLTLQSRIGILKRIKRHEDVLASARGPSAPLYAYLLTFFSGPTGQDDARRYFSREYLEAARRREGQRKDGSKAAAEVDPLRLVQRAQPQLANLPADVFLDMLASIGEVSLDGADATGYRVRMRMDAPGNGAGDVLAFVIKEGSAYKIRALGPQLEDAGEHVLALADRGDLKAARLWLGWARATFTRPTSEDVFAGLPFTHLWNPATGEEPGVEAIRVAAAALGTPADRALAALAAARKTATGDRHVAIELALAGGYLEAERHEAALEIARPLLAAHPREALPYFQVSTSLKGLRRFDEARRVAEERLALLPGDDEALHDLAHIASQAGAFKDARHAVEQLIEGGKAGASEYNLLAWNALFDTGATEQAIEEALKAVNMSRSGNRAILHTLAALYAEAGRPAEAFDILKKSMDAGSGEPRAEDWYVIGRVAEQYALRDVALSAYRKVPRPRVARADDTYTLVERRLTALSAPPARAGGDPPATRAGTRR